MHADALGDHAVRGASVYTLANAASDAQTAALAQRENSADRFLGPTWHGAPPEVARILASLVRQETRRGSSRLAHDLVGSLDQDLPMLTNPDRHAGFVVLKAADIPSVLVEMGFMSNPHDGFAGMEALPDGRVVLLERLETLAEQTQKLNYENRSQPGVRLIVLKPDGTVEKDQDEVDSQQPHSSYVLENGGIYSVHDDGTWELLDSIGHPPKDAAFGNFAAVAGTVSWNTHARTLPVFRSASRFYHDENGKLHTDKNAVFFLMGQPFVEGAAPLAERNGKIYDQVVCYPHGEFTHSVFVEDSIRKNYVLVDLIPADGDLEATDDHALFVDERGNLYEGVAKKDGYRIYEWKILE